MRFNKDAPGNVTEGHKFSPCQGHSALNCVIHGDLLTYAVNQETLFLIQCCQFRMPILQAVKILCYAFTSLNVRIFYNYLKFQ